MATKKAAGAKKGGARRGRPSRAEVAARAEPSAPAAPDTAAGDYRTRATTDAEKIEAQAQVLAALRPLGPEDRARVLKAVSLLLDVELR